MNSSSSDREKNRAELTDALNSEAYPFPEEFQEGLLAVMCRERDCLIRYSDVLSPTQFSKILHRETARILLKFYKTYHTIPTWEAWQQLLSDRFKEQPPVPDDVKTAWRQLMQKLFAIDMSNSSFITDRVILWVRDKAFEHAIIRAAELVDQAKTHGIREYDSARGLIAEALNYASGQDENLLVYFQETESRLANLTIHPLDLGEKIPTLIPSLDRVLDGGLGRGEMCVWAGPPNRGKTASLVNMTKAALLQGFTSVYITCESTKEVIAHRIDRAISRMPRDDMRNDIDKALLRVKNFSSFGGSLYVAEHIGKRASLEHIRNTVDRLKSLYDARPDLLVIDYPGEMHGDIRYNDRTTELAEIFREARAYAKEIHVSLHTANQMNRGSLSKPIVGMGDLARCFEVAAITDVMIGLCQTGEEEEEQTMRLFLAKIKEGKGHFVIPMRWQPEQMGMVEDQTRGSSSILTPIATQESVEAPVTGHA